MCAHSDKPINTAGSYNESFCSHRVPPACPTNSSDASSDSDGSGGGGLNNSESTALVVLAVAIGIALFGALMHYFRLDKNCMVYVDQNVKSSTTIGYEVM